MNGVGGMGNYSSMYTPQQQQQIQQTIQTQQYRQTNGQTSFITNMTGIGTNNNSQQLDTSGLNSQYGGYNSYGMQQQNYSLTSSYNPGMNPAALGSYSQMPYGGNPYYPATMGLPPLNPALTNPMQLTMNNPTQPSGLTLKPESSAASSPTPKEPPPVKKRKARTGSRSRVDADARANRIRKHNEAEVRRRQRLKCLLTELAESVECSKTHKSAVLRCAIERVRVMVAKLRDFGVNVSALLATAPDDSNPRGDEENEEDGDEEDAAPARAASTRQTRGATKKANGVKQEPNGFPASSTGSQSESSRPQSPSGELQGHVAKKQKLSSSGAGTPIDAVSTPPIQNRDIMQQQLVSTSNTMLYPPVSTQQQLLQPQHPFQPSAGAMSLMHAQSGLLGLGPIPVIGVNHHSLFHASQVPMDIIDHAGNILDCNEAFAKFTGYSRSILINPGTTFLGLTHPDSLSASYKLMSGLISGRRRVTRARKKYVTNTGAVRNSIVTCWLVAPQTLGADGTPVQSATTGGPLIQAMIEEIPLESELDDAYFDLPYGPQQTQSYQPMAQPQFVPQQPQQTQTPQPLQQTTQQQSFVPSVQTQQSMQMSSSYDGAAGINQALKVEQPQVPSDPSLLPPSSVPSPPPSSLHGSSSTSSLLLPMSTSSSIDQSLLSSTSPSLTQPISVAASPSAEQPTFATPSISSPSS